jgi:hypothetical protein
MPRFIEAGDPSVRQKGRFHGKVKLLALPERLLRKLSSVQYLDVKRRAGSDRLSVVLPNGESYAMDMVSIRALMNRLGMPPLEADKLLDFCFNFREVTVDLSTMRPAVVYERNRRLTAWGPKP